ncbi:glycine decarboxylase subunit P [Clydaea vesicula]|uniref:Glycine cleavage system P protein n=1 Tax=Clydaea vesicula TaxID=447962 RepID=A0AAD5U4A0_9FUNG|nr:glycine decarboxylase subunit P [Clydaea vesicula]
MLRITSTRRVINRSPTITSFKPQPNVASSFYKPFQLKKFSTSKLISQQKRSVLDQINNFPDRHVGPENIEITDMCKAIGVDSLDSLVQKALPPNILLKKPTNLGKSFSEVETLERLKNIAKGNKVMRSYIGMGYNGTITPPVILRNIMESPSWYTQYTPYQPEISQGRLESLINFQTMICDLTGLPIANASLLDEGTAAGEAMLLCYNTNPKKNVFFVDAECHPQTISCVQTRAQGFGIDVVVANHKDFDFSKYEDKVMGVLIQYPSTYGSIEDYEVFVKNVHSKGALVACATDLMALTLLKPPGDFGADIAFGNSQRFGVPLGYGGPHAAFFAVRDEHKRRMPGRLIGVSKDATGKPAYRLSLQTREQHIRREKATSNICTAQALLANMSAMYAVYHGAEGIKEIATRINSFTAVLASYLKNLGLKIKNEYFFDTLTVELPYSAKSLISAAENAGINLRFVDEFTVGVTLDETVNKEDLQDLIEIFCNGEIHKSYKQTARRSLNTSLSDFDSLATIQNGNTFPDSLKRTSTYLTHPVFNTYHSETEMLRYIVELQNKDLSLTNAMIPLGSCTMKLNATTEMIPVTWPEFSSIHPFAPAHQAKGYQILFDELSYALEQATGFEGMSLQPNSGAQGEYAGLRVIKAYLDSIGQHQRNICLIPVSAHGTNPASATMSGLKVVTVKCLPDGNLDLADFEAKAKLHKDNLAATMITYPSTFGVFEAGIVRACEIIHENGGQVYMDGANLNAQLGLCNPAEIGADVCHLNLHKTFCIPHGGGGPGMGPIGVKAHLEPFLPSHPVVPMGGKNAIGPVSAAPWGSASILPISWAYLKLMGNNINFRIITQILGDDGLRKATQVALLNANYLMKKLEPHYEILYKNENGYCAHEFIIDIRPFQSGGIEVIDVAKRLHDYGFHSPTMSFPVVGTLMIEPTESESKQELDRFVDAMISIKQEILQVTEGKVDKKNNLLKNSPHPVHQLLTEKWDKPYTREQAAYPLSYLRKKKFWPSVSR